MEYKVPENLREILGNDFDYLMPYDYSEQETGEDNSYLLQEALERISEVLENGKVYRAVESTKEGLNTFHLGSHWSGDIRAVSTRHNYGRFDDDAEIPTIIMEAEIIESDPYKLKKCINFSESIELQMWVGDIEDEIYFADTDCLQLTKICQGESLSEALEKFKKNDCELV